MRHGRPRPLTSTLPDSQSRAVWALGLFVAVQFADAVQTYSGISRFGPAVEGNPILCFFITACGTSVTLIGAKMIAVLGGLVLHTWSYHFALVALTVIYVFGAIVPWAVALGP
jgi:hypothetical protein